jgi:hypothetical protein
MVLVSVRHTETGLAAHARRCPARAPDDRGPRSLSFRHNGDDAQLVGLNVSQADTLQPDAFLTDEMSDPLLFLIDFDTIDATENFLQEVVSVEQSQSADAEALGQGLVLDEASATAMRELNGAPSESETPPPFLIMPESFSPPFVSVAHESPATTPSSTAAAATKCPLRSSDDLAQSEGRMGRAVNRSAGRQSMLGAEGVLSTDSPELVEPLAKRRRGNGKTNTVAA